MSNSVLIPPNYRDLMEKLWDASPATAPDYYSTSEQIADLLLAYQEGLEPSHNDRLLFRSNVEQKLDMLAEKGKIKRVWVYGRYGYRTLKDRDNRCNGAMFKKYWFGGD